MDNRIREIAESCEIPEGAYVDVRCDMVVCSAVVNAVQSKKEALALAVAAKRAIGAALQAGVEDRKFFHAKWGKNRVHHLGYWNMGRFNVNEVLVGIRVQITDEERNLMLTGNRIF